MRSRSKRITIGISGNIEAIKKQLQEEHGIEYSYAQLIDYLINYYLANNQRWYLADCTKAVKPLRWVLRQAPIFAPRVNENDPLVWDNHQYAWGAWGRATPAWSYSNPWAV